MADICIIGAGAAGISLALEFISHRLSVILLEGGDLEFDAKTQSLYEGQNASFVDFPLESTRLRYFGGSTNHWGGFTYPFNEFDFEPRAYIPVAGWPIPLQEIAVYYRRAGDLCQLGELDFTDVEVYQQAAGFSPIRLEGGPLVPSVARFSPPTRFGLTYRERLREASDVTVVLNSNVQELIADVTASQVEKAEVKCLGGANYAVAARVYVVAIGGLETARLLLLSRRQQATGLGNGHDLVGRYYMDHPGFSGGEVQFSDSAPSFEFFTGYHTVSGTRLYGIFTPRPEVLVRENIGNFRIQLSPHDSVPGIDSLRLLLKGRADWTTFRKIGYHIGNILVDLDQVVNVVYKSSFHRSTGPFENRTGARIKRSGAIMQVSAEQVPNPESRVVLSDKVDLFGQPELKLAWRLQDADRRTLTRSLRLFGAALSAAGYGRVRIPSELDESTLDPLVEVACHHMGTTRMSDGPKTGVVDGTCKVHGIHNLYIAGSSVFPTSSWVNPTLTIVALALRLADHLKSRYG